MATYPLRLFIPAEKTKDGVPVWIASDGATYQGRNPTFTVHPLTGQVTKTSPGVPFRRVRPNLQEK